MKRYVRSAEVLDLNEEERDYLEAKIVKEMQKMFPQYDVDDINRQGNRIGFGLYDEMGNDQGHYVFAYDPSDDDGPEEQLDWWLENTFE